jgi:ribonuclease P protein component
MEEKLLPTGGPEAERNSPFQTRKNLNSAFGAASFSQFDVSFLKGQNTFGKEEKLKSKKIIDQLFNEGKSVSVDGFTLIYLIQPLNTFYPAQVSFTVPKKNFKNATDRNCIKRLMREAYRLNKLVLYEKLTERKQQIAMMFIYKGKQQPEYEATKQTVINCINRIFK